MVASTTRTPYEEIYVKFFGNDTANIYIGYFTNGIAYSAGPVATTFETDSDYHTYAFEWTSGYIKWFIDGTQVADVSGTTPIPTSPDRFIVNFLAEVDGITTDDSSFATASSIGRNFM